MSDPILCDKCGGSNLVWTGLRLLSAPPLVQWQCCDCGHFGSVRCEARKDCGSVNPPSWVDEAIPNGKPPHDDPELVACLRESVSGGAPPFSTKPFLGAPRGDRPNKDEIRAQLQDEGLESAVEWIWDLQHEPRWIPVEEQPPNSDTDIFVLCDDGHVYEANYTKYRRVTARSGGHWFTLDKRFVHPTHWMPLPEPPPCPSNSPSSAANGCTCEEQT